MRLRHPAVLLAVCLGYFMAVLDATVVNVSLPDMARGFGAGVAGMQWVVDGYALVFASLLLTMGAVGDRWGNKETFVAGLGLFTLASALCGVAPSIGALVGFRAFRAWAPRCRCPLRSRCWAITITIRPSGPRRSACGPPRPASPSLPGPWWAGFSRTRSPGAACFW